MANGKPTTFTIKYVHGATGEEGDITKTFYEWLHDDGSLFQTARQVAEDWAYSFTDKGRYEINEDNQ